MGVALCVMMVIVGLGALYVVLPVMVHAYLQHRGSWIVECPEADTCVGVTLDTRHAAVTAAFGAPDLRVSGCARWPQLQHCDQICLR
jgi:hypothetical protein